MSIDLKICVNATSWFGTVLTIQYGLVSEPLTKLATLKKNKGHIFLSNNVAIQLDISSNPQLFLVADFSSYRCFFFFLQRVICFAVFGFILILDHAVFSLIMPWHHVAGFAAQPWLLCKCVNVGICALWTLKPKFKPSASAWNQQERCAWQLVG